MSWSVILPEAGTNLILNPVAMGTGNFGASGAGVTMVADSTYSYLGYKEYYIQGLQTGAYYGYLTLSTLTNAIHYCTFRSYGAIGAGVKVSLNGGTNKNTPSLLGKEGDWWVYGYSFPAAQASGATQLRFYNDTGTVAIRVGHAQVELNTYPTTPITGDIKGFCSDGYYWNGGAHVSSSTRAAKERKGGKVVDLNTTYNFMVNIGQGRGMPPIQHHVQDMALLPGSLYQGHKVLPRILDLVSTTVASTTATIAKARSDFINAVKPDRVSPEQPVAFRFTGANEDKPVDFYAYYDSGMEFAEPKDAPVARFICYDPFCYETHTQGAALTTSLSVANADFIARKINGAWLNVSSAFVGGAGNGVYALCRGADGYIYIGGQFVDIGDANGDNILKWNPYTSTLSSLATGANNKVYTLAPAPNGDIYLGGSFLDLGGATGDYIAYWDVSASAFVPLAALPNIVRSLAFGIDNTLFVGGQFTNVTDANGDYITKWNGTAFSSLGNGFNGIVWALAVAPNGDLYATGEFHYDNTGAGTLYNHIARWGTFDAVPAWHVLGTGLDDEGHALAIDKVGNVYVVGLFSHADGVACNGIAKWNGKTFEPLGSGLNGYGLSLAINDDGLLLVGGTFTSAGGITLADKFAIWNGTTWTHPDINFPGSPTAFTILPVNKDLYLGYDTEGSATTSYLNTITNNGSASAYPVIKINRIGGTSATLEWIKNETTGDTFWCNYSLMDGETLTIDLTPGNRSIKSDFYGDVWRAVLRSSDFSSFSLLPGENKISAFVNNTGATISAWLEAPITHWSSDTVAA